jgi:hypothetical protein
MMLGNLQMSARAEACFKNLAAVSACLSLSFVEQKPQMLIFIKQVKRTV